MENYQNFEPAIQERYKGYQDPGRGTMILVLGILSIILLGPCTGIPAWVMGAKDLKKIRNGIISFSANSSTKVGMILGIVSTSISIVAFIGVIAAIAIRSFAFSSNSSSKPSANEVYRAALVNECTMIAFHAQQYYKIPFEMGGGSNSFIGFQDYMSQNMSRKLNKSLNSGTLSIESIEPESLVIVGTGKEIGNDEINPIKIELKVYADRIEPVKILN